MWDALWEAGRPDGLIAAGGGAFDSLRLEKGYRLWGTDIHTDYCPYEAGLGWAVKLDKGEFLGRTALENAKARGQARKLCCMTLNHGGVVLGKEPIYAAPVPGEPDHTGRSIGYVTSANYGYSAGKFIVYGYLPIEHAAPGTQIEVEYFGERLAATVTAEPVFDPTGSRMKA